MASTVAELIYIEGGPWESKYGRHDYIKLLQPILILLLCPMMYSSIVKLHPIPVMTSSSFTLVPRGFTNVHEYVRTSRYWRSVLTGKKHTIYRHRGVAS